MLRLIVAPAMVLTTVLCASEGSAQPSPTTVTELGPLTTTGGARYRVLSREVGKPFIIDVVRVAAAGPASSAGKMPIVFVTDNDLMTTIVPAVARLGTSTFQFPSMIVVGIGYDTTAAKSPAEATVQGLARRATDFTPIHDDAYLAGVVPFTKQLFGIPWPADALLGRADRFLAFIDKELKPFIASQYPAADVADSTLVGHSLGGLFALHVLFTSPQSFARYIALSPGAAYGKEVLFREEAGLGNVAKRVFMGVGAHDTLTCRANFGPAEA